MAVSPLDTTAAESLLRSLELTVTRRLAGVLHGDFQGLLPATGTDLADTRPYEPGDDVRRIDWAASARSNDVQLRTTVEDRELTVYLVVDATGSMAFGSARTLKVHLAAAAAAAFGFLAARGANRVGGGVLGTGSPLDRGWDWLPPRSGRDTLRALLFRALSASGSDDDPATGDLGEALSATARAAARRGLVVVISDFAGPPTWHQPLQALAVRHDVVAVEILDERELQLTDAGVVTFEDPETGDQQVVDTSSSDVRALFAQLAAAHREEVRSAVLAAPADHLVLHTGTRSDGAFVVADGSGESWWLDQLIEWLRLRRRGLTPGARGTRR